MLDLATLGPTPTDLATRIEFTRVNVPLMKLVEAVGGTLQGRRFVDCAIHGPGIVVPTGGTYFDSCTLGDAKGDVRNLFVRATGPMIVGGVSLVDCRFEGCVLINVGYGGDNAFVDQFLAQLGGKS